MQVPDPSLATEVGVAGYIAIAMVLGGGALIAWFLRRMADAMDRIAETQSAVPAILSEIRTLLAERLDDVEQKLDRVYDTSQENLNIARLWRDTESTGRKVVERKTSETDQ